MSKIEHDEKDKMDKTKEYLLDTASEVQEKFNEVKDSVVDYTKKNPLKTAGFALLAGMVISHILRPRSKR